MSRARDFADLASTSSVSSLSSRNLIINGAMQVAQRGTSFTGSSEYTLDRFYFNIANTDQLACTVTQDSDAPDGFYNSLKVEVTTAETTLDSDEFVRVFHRFEGQNLQHLQYGTSSAKSVTLSFWVKASVTGDYAVLFYRALATGRSITKTYTINSANTWEYKTITIDGDQTTATPSDNVSRFEIDWALAAGTDWTSTDGTSWGTYVSGKFAYGQTANLSGTANATWQITGVQLELGSTATPFEHRSYGDELARCQRYFYSTDDSGSTTNYMNGGVEGSTSAAMGGFVFPTQMRSVPSVAFLGTNVTKFYSDATGVDDSVSVSTNRSSKDVGSFIVTGFTGAISGQAATVFNGGSGSGITFDAEL